jgi:RNA polymerase sigma factor (TIGR02999 family)
VSSSSARDVTQLLVAWSEGDQGALEHLVPLVESELRRLARHYMRGERPDHPLQTTALINEAYLRLIDTSRIRWQNRAHFFGVSAQLMRRVLVDFARARDSQKRGGAVSHVALDEEVAGVVERGADLVALDDALNALAGIDARKARVVELRYFGGLSVEETAEVLGVSTDTVTRDWKMAKAWLHRELRGDEARERGDRP